MCVGGRGGKFIGQPLSLKEVGEEQSERGPGCVFQLDKNGVDVGVTLSLARSNKRKRRFKYLVQIALGGRL